MGQYKLITFPKNAVEALALGKTIPEQPPRLGLKCKKWGKGIQVQGRILILLKTWCFLKQ